MLNVVLYNLIPCAEGGEGGGHVQDSSICVGGSLFLILWGGGGGGRGGDKFSPFSVRTTRPVDLTVVGSHFPVALL
jgi:hypothetical protein